MMGGLCSAYMPSHVRMGVPAPSPGRAANPMRRTAHGLAGTSSSMGEPTRATMGCPSPKSHKGYPVLVAIHDCHVVWRGLPCPHHPQPRHMRVQRGGIARCKVACTSRPTVRKPKWCRTTRFNLAKGPVAFPTFRQVVREVRLAKRKCESSVSLYGCSPRKLTGVTTGSDTEVPPNSISPLADCRPFSFANLGRRLLRTEADSRVLKVRQEKHGLETGEGVKNEGGERRARLDCVCLGLQSYGMALKLSSVPRPAKGDHHITDEEVAGKRKERFAPPPTTTTTTGEV